MNPGEYDYTQISSGVLEDFDSQFISAKNYYYPIKGSFVIEEHILENGNSDYLGFSKGYIENARYLSGEKCVEIDYAAWNTMPECLSDVQCNSLKPVCHPGTYTCIQSCNTNPEICSEGEVCAENGLCIAANDKCDMEGVVTIANSGSFSVDFSNPELIFNDDYSSCEIFKGSRDAVFKLEIAKKSDVLINVSNDKTLIGFSSTCGNSDICSTGVNETLDAGTYYLTVENHYKENTELSVEIQPLCAVDGDCSGETPHCNNSGHCVADCTNSCTDPFVCNPESGKCYDPNAAYGNLSGSGNFPYTLDYNKMEDLDYMQSHYDALVMGTIFTGSYGETGVIPGKNGQTLGFSVKYLDTVIMLQQAVDNNGNAQMIQLSMPSSVQPNTDYELDVNGNIIQVTNYTNNNYCLIAFGLQGTVHVTVAEGLDKLEGGKIGITATDVKLYYPTETPWGDLSANAGGSLCPKEQVNSQKFFLKKYIYHHCSRKNL